MRPLFILFLCEISFKKSLKCFTVSCFLRYHSLRNSPPDCFSQIHYEFGASWQGTKTNKKADLRPLFILFLCEISFKKSLECFTVSCFLRYHSLRNSPPDCFSQIHYEFGASWQGTKTNKKADLRPLFILFLCEISFKKSFKCFTVSSFVPCHFMYCIVDCIKTLFFSKLCKLCFTESCTVFCRCSHFKIFLC